MQSLSVYMVPAAAVLVTIPTVVKYQKDFIFRLDKLKNHTIAEYKIKLHLGYFQRNLIKNLQKFSESNKPQGSYNYAAVCKY